MAVNPRGLALLVFDAFVLAVIVLGPMGRNHDRSDAGSGPVVLMRPPLRPSYTRCGVFLLSSLALSVSVVGLRAPNLVVVYHHLVQALLLGAVADRQAVSTYTSSLLPVFQASVLVFGLSFAVAFRASSGRRVMIILNAGLFLLVSAVVDALFGLVLLTTHLPLGPAPILDVGAQYLVAGVMLLRMQLTTSELPRKTQLPLLRAPDWASDFVLVTCVGFAAAATGAGATLLAGRFGDSPLAVALILFACPPYFFAATTLSLGLVRLMTHRRAEPGYDRPPIDVIIPAYNEELVIGRLLVSLDVAAGRYRGPVCVILCDDGSSDRTVEVASRVMGNFRYARGRAIRADHSGKSGALNQALRACTAEYVFRIDADCEAHPDCFVYSVPYFLADPGIGLVSAFTLPKEPYATWIDRMRMFELVVLFGLIRPAADVVDGIFCVPGTFTGFRRRPALRIGGFVEGMYGEDVEFTYSMARVGYRAVIDTRVISYEDVPNTQRQLRIQRTRWNRGGTMAYARHLPIVTGFTGPRFWFFATRQAIRRLLMPFRMTLLLFLVAQAAFSPTPHMNLPRLAAIIALRALPSVLQTVACTVYYGRARQLLWLPLQYVFVVLKHYYALESFLSFNARPVTHPSFERAAVLPEVAPPASPAFDTP